VTLAVLSGVVYVALLTICIALAKAAALGDRQAEIARLPFRPRLVSDEPERPAAPVVPLPRDGGRAA
jgi:hypothetical protein